MNLQITLTGVNTGAMLVKVTSNDAFFNECNWAIVVLDQELKDQITKAKMLCDEAKKMLEWFCCIKIFNRNNVHWLPNDVLSEDDEDKFSVINSYHFIEPIDNETLKRSCEEFRTEGGELTINQHGFHFNAYAKNTPYLMETEMLMNKNML